MHPVKLLERATSTAVHVVRHPLSAAAYTAGVARGLAGAALHGLSGDVTTNGPGSGPEETGLRAVPTQRPASEAARGPQATVAPQTNGGPVTATDGPREPQRVAKPVPRPEDLPEPVVIFAEDEEPGEAFATEPKAVSRESAHGGGTATDAEIDAWIDEAMARGGDADAQTPVGTTTADAGRHADTAPAASQQSGTQPVLDPGTAKAILAEADTLRKAAERDPE